MNKFLSFIIILFALLIVTPHQVQADDPTLTPAKNPAGLKKVKPIVNVTNAQTDTWYSIWWDNQWPFALFPRQKYTGSNDSFTEVLKHPYSIIDGSKRKLCMTEGQHTTSWNLECKYSTQFTFTKAADITCNYEEKKEKKACQDGQRLFNDFYKDDSTSCNWTPKDPSFHLEKDPLCAYQVLALPVCSEIEVEKGKIVGTVPTPKLCEETEATCYKQNNLDNRYNCYAEKTSGDAARAPTAPADDEEFTSGSSCTIKGFRGIVNLSKNKITLSKNAADQDEALFKFRMDKKAFEYLNGKIIQIETGGGLFQGGSAFSEQVMIDNPTFDVTINGYIPDFEKFISPGDHELSIVQPGDRDPICSPISYKISTAPPAAGSSGDGSSDGSSDGAGGSSTSDKSTFSPLGGLKGFFANDGVIKRYKNLGGVSGAILNLFYIAGGFLMLYWLIWGVFQYIIAQGNKETLAKARSRMTWAVLGFLFLMMSYMLGQYVQTIFERRANQTVQEVTTPPPVK